jgi:hypothetical protein
MNMDNTYEDRREWVAADYAAYYDRVRRQVTWRFNLLIEVIAVALDDERKRQGSK